MRKSNTAARTRTRTRNHAGMQIIKLLLLLLLLLVLHIHIHIIHIQIPSVLLVHAKRHHHQRTSSRHRSSKTTNPSLELKRIRQRNINNININTSASTRNQGTITITGTGNEIIPKKKIPGTQITGAGHHNRRNRSIFHSSASLSSFTSRSKSESENGRSSKGSKRSKSSSKSSSKSKISASKGTNTKGMYARMTPRGKLLFYIPKHDQVISLAVASKQPSATTTTATTNPTPKLDIRYVPQTASQSQLLKEQIEEQGWIPLEGIYGIFILPSGPHLVLITECEETYKIHASMDNNTNDIENNVVDDDDDDRDIHVSDTKDKEPFMNLQRIVAMEIVRIPYSDGHKGHKRTEERRQFGVLRNSLKEHEFYYIKGRDGGMGMDTGMGMGMGRDMESGHIPVVQDVTHTLQRSFVHWAAWNERYAQKRERERERVLVEQKKRENESVQKDVTGKNEVAIEVEVPMPAELMNATLQELGSNDNVLNASLSIMVPSNIMDGKVNGNDDAIVGEDGMGDNDEKSSWLWTWFSSLKSTPTSIQPKPDVEELSVYVSEEAHLEQNASATAVEVDDSYEYDDGHDCNSDSDSEVSDKFGSSPISWWSTMQKNDNKHSDNGQCMFQRPDSRFFWNEECVMPLLRNYEDQNHGMSSSSPSACHLLLDCTIPVTSAFVGIQRNIALAPNTTTGAPFSVKYDQLLFSRRSKYRAGTRFTKRGADSRGDVANFAETEQICIVRNDTSKDDIPRIQELYSHVQTRGSIPLRWSSPTDIKTYRPRVMIGTNPLAQARALRNHLIDQLSLYSTFADFRKKPGATLVFINLIDKHSDQGRLGRAFGAVLDAVLATYQDEKGTNKDIVPSLLKPGSVSNVWFDFHAELKKGRWDRLKYLLDDVRPCLDNHGYFCAIPAATSAWEILGLQNGVVRTNCMDCLDRTNVVQSMFGRYILYQQFCDRFGLKAKTKRKLPIGYNVAFKRKMVTLPWNTGELAHRFLWADNADAISRLYAGTPALKGDFTRTGKRTKRGALDDGVNSVTRFYLNNFLDADRQEGMDLLTGYAQFDTSEEQSRLDNYRARTSPQKSKNRFMDLFRREKKLDAIALDSRLSLTWLPGDLQNHMRSSALSSLALQDVDAGAEGVSLSSALRDVDRRAMLDDPWWVNDSDDEDQKESSKKKKKLVARQLSIIKSSSSGTSLAALIASIKAPMTTAVAYICFIIPGLLGNE